MDFLKIYASKRGGGGGKNMNLATNIHPWASKQLNVNFSTKSANKGRYSNNQKDPELVFN